MARYKLEDIFDLQMGKTPSRNNSEYWNTCDNKWISIGDLTQAGKYITDTKEYLSDVAVEESGIKIIPANTVVMSFKLSIGKTAITSEDMYSNEAIMAFHDKHVVDLMPEYIYYMFKYKDWDEGTNKAVMGKTLNKATLSKVEIEVCPLEKQKEIVELLDKVSTVLDGRNEELKKLDELIKARFVEMFGRPALNDKKWEEYTLAEVCNKITDGEHKNPEFVEEGVPMVMANNVQDHGVTFEGCRYITEDDYKKFSKKCRPEKGDVLLVSRGATIGRCCENNKDEEFALMGSVILMKKKEIIASCYLVNWLKNDDIRPLIYTTSAASAQQAIYMKDLSTKRIMLPPMDLQNQFSEFVKQVDKSKVVVQESLDKEQMLFDSLMQEYFG